uniref:Phospholipase A(2) n=1 Tax=Gongylonema pulchrum TaxID=637853 RepID=A0A183DL66_9BILA
LKDADVSEVQTDPIGRKKRKKREVDSNKGNDNEEENDENEDDSPEEDEDDSSEEDEDASSDDEEDAYDDDVQKIFFTCGDGVTYGDVRGFFCCCNYDWCNKAVKRMCFSFR